jgi:hypothetical protein
MGGLMTNRNVGRNRGAVGLVLAALFSTAPAAAQSRSLQSIWMVQPVETPTSERVLASGEFVLKQRLLPTGLAELGSAITLGSATLAMGTQLVEAQTQGAKVFCTPQVARQKLIGASFQPCLIDTDQDGDFDGWFNAISQTKGLLSLAGKWPKKPKPLAEAGYRTVAVGTMREEFFVAIERRNYFNIYSRESFMIAFGREGQLERLTTPVSFKSVEMPKMLTVMGAQFEAISETDGKMTVRVHSAMPEQPFGVMTTTTYRFY